VMVVPTITVEASLHPAQEAVWTSTARFRVVGCGRRFGKTHLGVLEIIHHALNVDGAIAWWISPTHEQSDIAYRMFLSAVPEDLIELNRTTKVITFKHNLSRVQFKSADRDKNLRGEGLTFVVLDEAAFIKPGTWSQAIRPALSDRKGGALLIGTFDGTENWFYEEFERGQDTSDTETDSWRFPTSANPYIDDEEIEAARRSLPKAEFAQEYLADPMSFVGAVFDSEDVVQAVELGRTVLYDERLTTYAGVDWGYTNPTAFLLCQQTTDDYVRWFEEKLWHSVELNDRCQEIALYCRQYRVKAIYADAAGADENVTLAKHLKAAGMRTSVVPVPFNKFKDAGITARRWFLENGRELLGPRMRQTVIDSKRYRYKETAAGVRQDEVVKENDHTCDAATAFYATRFPAASGRVKT
jgi:hypothetical protein